MNCAPYDLRDYYFEALEPAEHQKVKDHVSGCETCAAELDRLRLTALALAALPDEEIPRRIGFVSDKVFEPSPIRRSWQAFWQSGARMSFAAALVLACAILVHAFYQPAVPVAPQHSTTPVAVAQPDPAVIQAAVDKAVAAAVARTEARYDARLQEIQAKYAREQQLLMVRVAETLDVMEKRHNVLTVSYNRGAEGQ